jgi:hypothetical protein
MRRSVRTARNVGQRVPPVRAKGAFLPHLKFKNSVKMHPPVSGFFIVRWRQARRLSYDLAKLNLEIIPVINKIDLGDADVAVKLRRARRWKIISRRLQSGVRETEKLA